MLPTTGWLHVQSQGFQPKPSLSAVDQIIDPPKKSMISILHMTKFCASFSALILTPWPFLIEERNFFQRDMQCIWLGYFKCTCACSSITISPLTMFKSNEQLSKNNVVCSKVRINEQLCHVQPWPFPPLWRNWEEHAPKQWFLKLQNNEWNNESSSTDCDRICCNMTIYLLSIPQVYVVSPRKLGLLLGWGPSEHNKECKLLTGITHEQKITKNDAVQTNLPFQRGRLFFGFQPLVFGVWSNNMQCNYLQFLFHVVGTSDIRPSNLDFSCPDHP